jgi:hypothetical protein
MGGVHGGFSGVVSEEPLSTSTFTLAPFFGAALAGELERCFFFYGWFGSSEGWGLDGEAVSDEYASCARRNQ